METTYFILQEINCDGKFTRGIFSTKEKTKKMREVYRKRYEDWYEDCGFQFNIIESRVKVLVDEDEYMEHLNSEF